MSILDPILDPTVHKKLSNLIYKFDLLPHMRNPYLFSSNMCEYPLNMTDRQQNKYWLSM